jgi:hypothetical protein
VKDVPDEKVRDRLKAARAALEHIDLKRSLRGDPNIDRTLEDRIVWRELFDLELQNLDEQIARMSESARSLCARPPRPSVPTLTKPAKRPAS